MFPGTYIYVDPRGFDPSVTDDITKLGVGGYYMITQTDHSLGPGKFDTSISAKWVAQAVKEAEAADAEDTTGGANPDDPDCQTKRKDAMQQTLEGFGSAGEWLADALYEDNGTSGSEEEVT